MSFGCFVNVNLTPELKLAARMDFAGDREFMAEDFLKQVLALVTGDDPLRNRRRLRRATRVDVQSIISATAASYQVDPEEYVGYRSGVAGRDLAAY